MIINSFEVDKVIEMGEGKEIHFKEIREGLEFDFSGQTYKALSNPYLSLDLPEGTYELVVEKISTVPDLVHPDNEGFAERITPKKPPKELYMFKCRNKVGRVLKKECGNIHYRHAGYIEVLVPFIRPGDERRVSKDNHQVMVCTKCKSCYVWVNEQMYDVTDQIDLKAWEEVEEELHEATGPGGQC